MWLDSATLRTGPASTGTIVARAGLNSAATGCVPRRQLFRPAAAAQPLPPPPLSQPTGRSRSRGSISRRAGGGFQGGQPDAWQPASPEYEQDVEEEEEEDWVLDVQGQQPCSRSGFVSWLERTDNFVVALVRALLSISLLKQISELVAVVPEALALIRQLHSPRLGFVLKRTVQVMVVTALFVVYVAAVDWVWGYIPRFIDWSHAHPGWVRRAGAASLVSVKQLLVLARQLVAGT